MSAAQRVLGFVWGKASALASGGALWAIPVAFAVGVGLGSYKTHQHHTAKGLTEQVFNLKIKLTKEQAAVQAAKKAEADATARASELQGYLDKKEIKIVTRTNTVTKEVASNDDPILEQYIPADLIFSNNCLRDHSFHPDCDRQSKANAGGWGAEKTKRDSAYNPNGQGRP